MSYILLEEVTDAGVTELTTHSEDVFELHSAALSTAQQAWFDGNEVIIAELTLDKDWEKPMCNAQTYGQTLETPAEYCENETVLGSEYCNQHVESE